MASDAELLKALRELRAAYLMDLGRDQEARELLALTAEDEE